MCDVRLDSREGYSAEEIEVFEALADLNDEDYDDEIEGVPCEVCGDTETPLHTNGVCGNCFIPDET